jgi:hypothetical protein
MQLNDPSAASAAHCPPSGSVTMMGSSLLMVPSSYPMEQLHQHIDDEPHSGTDHYCDDQHRY